MIHIIPSILHRTVPTRTTPLVEDFWDRWRELHPRWDLVTWRDPLDAGDWETGHLWKHCVAGAQRGGMIRLEVLWRFGGVYVDSDLEPVRSLNPLLMTSRAFAVREDMNCIPDFVLGAPARHPAIRACLDMLLAMPLHEIQDRKRGPWTSGPGITTAVFGSRIDVNVLPSVTFAPYHWSVKDAEAKKDWTKNPDTFAIHRWAASWGGASGHTSTSEFHGA